MLTLVSEWLVYFQVCIWQSCNFLLSLMRDLRNLFKSGSLLIDIKVIFGHAQIWRRWTLLLRDVDIEMFRNLNCVARFLAKRCLFIILCGLLSLIPSSNGERTSFDIQSRDCYKLEGGMNVSVWWWMLIQNLPTHTLAQFVRRCSVQNCLSFRFRLSIFLSISNYDCPTFFLKLKLESLDHPYSLRLIPILV